MGKPTIRFEGYTDDWEQRKLEDIIEKLTGGASIAPDDYVDAGYRTIPKGAVNSSGIADMSGCKIVSEDFFKKNISSKTSSGELVTSLRDLVSTAPNMGRIVRICGDYEDFLMPQGVYSIIVKKKISEDFLIAYSNSPEYRKIIMAEKNGSTQVHIRNGEFLNIDIPLPSYEEQMKIGKQFNYLDHLITLHQRKYINGKKEELLAWEQRKLGELAEIVGGGTPSTGMDSYWDGDIDWYAPAEIGEQIYLESSQRKITEEGLNKSSAKILPIGTVLFTSRAGIGKTAILLKEGCTNQGFQSIVPNKEKLDSYFIFTRSEELKEYGEKVGAGSTFVEVSGKQMANMDLMMPKTMSEQQQIGEYFQTIDHLITLHQRKCEETKKLKKFMLQKMFPQKGEKVPKIRFDGFTDDWEQRKFGDLVEKYEDPVKTPTEGYMRLGIRSHAKGTFHSYVEKGKELETAKMFRVAADKFIVNITFGWEHAVAITDEDDAGKLVSHRFPQYSFNNGILPKFFRYLILDEKFKHHLELSSPGGAGRNRVLKLSDMLEYKMNFPCEEEQRKIAVYFDDLDHLITLHQRKCEELQNIKKFMLQNMFV